MNILFVWPKSPGVLPIEKNESKYLFKLISKIVIFRRPMTFSILAALTPKEYNIKVVEGEYKDINFNEKYDLVGITSTTCFANMAYEIADEFRRHNVKVVLGGWHASALPKEAKQHADAVIIGEAEETWPKLLQDFKFGKLKPFYMPTKPADPTSIPHPYDVYPNSPGIGIQATRGCPMGCSFCSITNTQHTKVFRKRPLDFVIEEIILNTDKLFIFQDASLTIDRNYTKELFKKMKGLNKKFLAMGNINILGEDEELLKASQEAGCLGWLIGFESICQDSINIMGKKGNKVDRYLKQIKKIHDYGMAVEGTFVFGFDTDAIDIFDKTDEFIRKSGIKSAFPHFLMPYPGTPIFDKLDKQGRILTKDWSKYNQSEVVYKPKNMAPEELLNNVIQLEQKLHKNLRILEIIIKNFRFGGYHALDIAIFEAGWKLAKLKNKGRLNDTI
jgi:radical SAM superfamily enzyme YgiQ (UPF0313 family)